jgi:hypothetical protein
LLSRGPAYLTATGYARILSSTLVTLARSAAAAAFPSPNSSRGIPTAAVFRPSHPCSPSNAHPVRNPSAPDLLPGHGRAAGRRSPHRRRQHPGEPPARSRGWNRNCFVAPTRSRPISSSLLQPFFVLHKAAPAASSGPASRGRRRTDASQPSSPGPKSSKRPRDVDAADEDGSELYERLRMEAFHRTWSKIQSTIDVCPSLLRITILTYLGSIS